MTLSHTFGRSKSNHLYTSCKEGTCINIMTVPLVLPLSPHTYSLGWWCQSGDGGSGHGHTRCACVGGVAETALLGRTPEQSNTSGPAPSLAAGITAGPGQDGQCLELCICEYIHLHGDIPVNVCTYTCIAVYSYGGGFFPLLISFLHLQAFLGRSVLQLLPKGHTFGFRLTKINRLQEFP